MLMLMLMMMVAMIPVHMVMHMLNIAVIMAMRTPHPISAAGGGEGLSHNRGCSAKPCDHILNHMVMAD
jgi:hypothetical protein